MQYAPGGDLPPYGPSTEYRSTSRRRPKPRKRPLLISAVVATLALAVVPVLNFFDVFSDNGEPMSFDRGPGADGAPDGGATGAADPDVLFPTGPRTRFTTANTLDDGTKMGVTTLAGKKSGFTGKVWVWAPKQYYDPRYARSGFPVLIALPGGPGYPNNYWMGTDLKLQSSIAQWADEGRSLPFIVVMPVLNPNNKFYYDGSDIPGQPRMGTWMTEDVPDLVKANFRTFKSRDGWAFMGSSSGGFVGLKSVLKHPDKFKAVIASGPDTRPDSPLWKGHEKEQQENNPERFAKELSMNPKGPDVYIAFQIGNKESGRPDLEKFIKNYGKGPVHIRLKVIPNGGHNAKTYVPAMGDGPDAPITWISGQLRGPTPSS